MTTRTQAAFPRPHSENKFNEDQAFAQQGLTKLEYFMAIAMQGLCANPIACRGPDYIAAEAMDIATAAIRELEKVT